MARKPQHTFIDLFAGIGGFRLATSLPVYPRRNTFFACH
jgi:hypothetical protein